MSTAENCQKHRLRLPLQLNETYEFSQKTQFVSRQPKWQNIVTACLSLSIFFVKFSFQTSPGSIKCLSGDRFVLVGYGVPWFPWSSAATGKTISHQQGGVIYQTRHSIDQKPCCSKLKKSLWVKFAIIWIIYYDILLVTFFWINTHLSGLFWCYLHCWSPCCCIDHLGTQHVSICLDT